MDNVREIGSGWYELIYGFNKRNWFCYDSHILLYLYLD